MLALGTLRVPMRPRRPCGVTLRADDVRVTNQRFPLPAVIPPRFAEGGAIAANLQALTWFPSLVPLADVRQVAGVGASAGGAGCHALRGCRSVPPKAFGTPRHRAADEHR